MAFEELKAKQSVMWGSGPYKNISDHLTIAHDHLMRVFEPRAGERWLDLATGTGIVHIAPGCGGEDFELSRVHDLPILTPVDEAGRFYDDYGVGTLDIHAFLHFDFEPLARHPRAQLEQWRAQYLEHAVAPMILPKALELITSHEARGWPIISLR